MAPALHVFFGFLTAAPHLANLPALRCLFPPTADIFLLVIFEALFCAKCNLTGDWHGTSGVNRDGYAIVWWQKWVDKSDTELVQLLFILGVLSLYFMKMSLYKFSLKYPHMSPLRIYSVFITVCTFVEFTRSPQFNAITCVLVLDVGYSTYKHI